MYLTCTYDIFVTQSFFAKIALNANIFQNWWVSSRELFFFHLHSKKLSHVANIPV